jgi:hypothetical protein
MVIVGFRNTPASFEIIGQFDETFFIFTFTANGLDPDHS